MGTSLTSYDALNDSRRSERARVVNRHLGLRTICWGVILTLGALQAWVTRFAMAPDGISYLDMGDAYWRGDWHNAINAYWSPLYSWILALFVNGIRPNPYWEYPVVHLANFFIFVATLACFEYFLATFIKSLGKTAALAGPPSTSAERALWLLGYSLFLATSLMLVGLYRVCPDMCVAAVVYVASALIIQIKDGQLTRGKYALLGLVLGLGYLAKAVMFPLAFVFIAVVLISKSGMRRSIENAAISLLVFLAVAAPLCAAISWQKHHLTFGESGSWNYALYINGMRYWATEDPALLHPVRRILESPPVYEFGTPVGGTYPPWYDPTYWHEGIRSRMAIHATLANLLRTGRVYAGIFFLLFGNVVAGLLILLMREPIKRYSLQVLRCWAIVLPAIATFAVYALVHVEGRFIAAPVAILFLALYSGTLNKSWTAFQRVILAVVCASSLAITLLAPHIHWPVSNMVYAYPHPLPDGADARAAEALREGGLKANDKVGLIWDETWGRGAARGAFVPRLLRATIVSEVTDADSFWKLGASARDEAISAIRSTGAKMILARQVPPEFQGQWQRLAGTGYFAYWVTQH